MKPTVSIKHNPLCGFYAVATVPGRTVVASGYHKTEQAAREELSKRLKAYQSVQQPRS
jgi:hypothetical protein